MEGKRFTISIVVLGLGIVLFVLGSYLVHELILKFLKFAIGLFLIFISIPMILGGLGAWRVLRGRPKVVRMYRHD
ncbi:hypothetical protein KY359_05690 [Candidatus Woesearchaeota archaeon]|nr:hypothetical protein [Candidatus Woesearchaeota archaeon]